MKEMVTLNRKEQRSLIVLNQVEVGKMVGREASGCWSAPYAM
jgi:hypothetical protein